jgi:hypothetical protein
MLTRLFPDIYTKEELIASMDEFTLYGGWTCALAPLTYLALPEETAYAIVTGLSVFYISIMWINLIRILCK